MKFIPQPRAAFTSHSDKLIFQRRFVRTHAINGSFLDDGIISHRHAWMWGLLLTDGYLVTTAYSMGWRMRYDTYPTLDRLRTILDSSHPLHFDCNESFGKTFHSVSLDLYSKHIHSKAVDLLNCNPSRKSYEVQMPSHINPEHMASLIRGIYEGDGCWTINRVTGDMDIRLISANKTFLQSVRSTINAHCLQS